MTGKVTKNIMIESPIRLLGLDLDGTLLGEDSRVHDRERQTLQRARAAGVAVALCTGRSIVDTLAHAEAAGGVDWIITENGARITSADGREICRHEMTPQHIDRLLTLCEAHGVEPSFYGERTIWFGDKCQGHFDQISRIIGRLPLNLPHYRHIEDPAQWRALARETIFKAIVYGDARELNAWLADMRASGLFESEPSVFCGLMNVEINAKGTDKGAALLHLAGHLGLTAGQVMACGDSDNDRAMLEAAGLGVAMANAPEHIRALADVTTESNARHGVSRAIERYILSARSA